MNVENNIDVNVFGKIFNDFLLKCKLENKKYDNDVRLDRKKQKYWINSVHQQLENLKNYELKETDTVKE